MYQSSFSTCTMLTQDIHSRKKDLFYSQLVFFGGGIDSVIPENLHIGGMWGTKCIVGFKPDYCG